MGGGHFGFLFDDSGQPILRLEFLPHVLVGNAHAGPDQGPVAVDPQIEQRVEIDRLVGAMEIADAEMDDAGREVTSGIYFVRMNAGSYRATWKTIVMP